MRRGVPVVFAVSATSVVLALSAPMAAAQEPTARTQATAPHAVGDAATGLAVVRLLPNTNGDTGTGRLGNAPGAELTLGLAAASANTEATSSPDRAVAQASPGGVVLAGQSPQTPGTLSQTAPPDNAAPLTSGITPPVTPLDNVIKVGALTGSVHARWNDTAGPCVGRIADAGTELGSLSALSAIPSLPGVTDLTGLLLDKALVEGLKKLGGPLATLGGVLGGLGTTGTAVLNVPDAVSARSTVELVDIPGGTTKAVRSTSTMRIAAVKLLAGSPFEVAIKVVSPPTLQVTSTGDAATSTVIYSAPVLDVAQGGRSLGRLDATNPKLDIPIGIPLPGSTAPAGVGDLPIVGTLLGNGQQVTDAISQGLQKLDLGVLRLSVATLSQQGSAMTTPFAGHQLGATARMLDLQVLPTSSLGLPGLPSALAQVALGEQTARAYAPTGGVVCGTAAQTPQTPPTPSPKPAPPLAYTNAAYQSVPMFWTGTTLLLVGVVLVAALPTRRVRPAGTTSDTPDDTTEDTTDTAPEVPTDEPDGIPPG